VVGGLAFILPGLALVIALSALLLADSPPPLLVGAALGMGAAVPAVALAAGVSLGPSSWARAASKARWGAYAIAGAAVAAAAGPWVVLVLLACGAVEVVLRTGAPRPRGTRGRSSAASLGPLWLMAAPAATLTTGLAASVAWVAFKVGALSYGGGFVIVPLMQGDAVTRYGWLTPAQFSTAVALGQVTPGPVVHTVAAVGFGAAGVAGALLAALVAFGPSFVFILVGARHLSRLASNLRARAFLDGAGPAAIGAILGSAVPLALGLTATWQWAVLAAAAVAMLALRRGVVPVLLVAAGVGAAVTALGG
jgi:chromate transporter